MDSETTASLRACHSRQLKRLARRVSVGLGRTGAIEGDESGDIILAFSTANANADEGNSAQPLFTAVVQATEESMINAIIAAKTMTGADYWVVPALPHDQLQQVLRKHGLRKE